MSDYSDMNQLCNDILRLFAHHGKASVTYTFSSSNRKHSHLFTQRYTEESKRRLTVISKDISAYDHDEITSWIPYLPNGLIEGIEYTVEEFWDGASNYTIRQYRNDKRDGLGISYYSRYTHVDTYVNGVKHGLEQTTNYDGTILLQRQWINGSFVRNHL